MSIANLRSAQYLDVNVHSVTAEFHKTQDIECSNLIVDTGAELPNTNITDDCIIQGTLQMGTSATKYILPNETGLQNQVLKLTGGTTNLEWANVDMGDTNISADGTNIIVDEVSASEYTIGLNTQLTGLTSVSSALVNTAFLTIEDIQFPLPSSGTENQVLSLDGSGNMIWGNVSEGSIEASGNQIIVSEPTPTNYKIALNTQLGGLESMSCNDAFCNNLSIEGTDFPLPSTGLQNQVLSLDGSGNMIWGNVSEGSIEASGNQIIVSEPTPTNYKIALNTQLGGLESMSCNDAFCNNLSIEGTDFPLPSTGLENQVLSLDGSGNMIWANNSSSQTDISGSTNITVSNPSPDTFTISLNSGLTNLNNVSTVSTNTTTLNVNGSSFSNPQAASTNQILSIDASKNMVWVNNSSNGVQSVNSGSNITVDNSDAANPIVNLSGTITDLTTVSSETVSCSILNINNVNFPNPLNAEDDQFLSVDKDGAMVWVDNSPSQTDISGSTNITVNEISVDSFSISLNDTVIGLTSLSTTGLNINGSSFSDPQAASTNQMIYIDASKNIKYTNLASKLTSSDNSITITSNNDNTCNLIAVSGGNLNANDFENNQQIEATNLNSKVALNLDPTFYFTVSGLFQWVTINGQIPYEMAYNATVIGNMCMLRVNFSGDGLNELTYLTNSPDQLFLANLPNSIHPATNHQSAVYGMVILYQAPSPTVLYSNEYNCVFNILNNGTLNMTCLNSALLPSVFPLPVYGSENRTAYYPVGKGYNFNTTFNNFLPSDIVFTYCLD
jgi:hypothetical protein